jgi:hypothetical protein
MTWNATTTAAAKIDFLRIGKDSGTTPQTYRTTIGGNQVVDGAIEAYGGDVYISANLTSTSNAPNASGVTGFRFKATKNVINNAQVALRTAGAPITFWSDADVDSVGAAAIYNGTSICTAWNNTT